MAEAIAAAAPSLSANPAARAAYGAHAAAKPEDRTEAAAKDFEAVFLTQMMQSMFAGLGDEGPMGGGEAMGTYRSMLADEYGKTIAASGGIGLADHVRRELIAAQQGTGS
jgi:flagellar protein FlgJ